MTKTKKALKWTAIVLAFLLLGVPLLLAAINAFDEDLKPEAIAFADFSDEEVAPEQNGYYAWVGLRAPVRENAHTRGVQIVAQVNEKLDMMPREVVSIDTFLGAKALKSTNNLAGLCGRDATGCLARYRARIFDLEEQVRKNKLLLQRYRGLYRYQHFRETIKARYYGPFFSDPAIVSGLARAQHALMALHGDHRQALRQLRDDTLFWRLVLIETRGLINKMIALAAIHRNAQLTSEIVSLYPADKDALVLATQAMQPLTGQERDLTRVYRYEFALVMHLINSLPAEQELICTDKSITDCLIESLTTTFLFKPHATTNQSFENFGRIAMRSQLPAVELLKERESRQADDQQDWNWISSWRFAYNPVGKILNAIAVPAYGSYTARVHNLDGFLRLVSLAITAKQQSVRDTDMHAFLARAQPNLRNPYTNEPMLWDAGNRMIYFNGMGEKHDGELLDKRVELQL